MVALKLITSIDPMTTLNFIRGLVMLIVDMTLLCLTVAAISFAGTFVFLSYFIGHVFYAIFKPKESP